MPGSGYDNDRESSRGRFSRSEGTSSGSSSRSSGDRDNRRGSWFGDAEGHSEAARRGWEHRESRGRSSYDDDELGRSSRRR